MHGMKIRRRWLILARIRLAHEQKKVMRRVELCQALDKMLDIYADASLVRPIHPSVNADAGHGGGCCSVLERMRGYYLCTCSYSIAKRSTISIIKCDEPQRYSVTLRQPLRLVCNRNQGGFVCMPWIGGARHVRWESPPIYMAFRVGGSCIFERGSPHRNVHRQSVIPVRTFRTASFGSKIQHAHDQLEGNKIPIALDSGDAVSTRGLAIVAAPKS